VNHFDAVWIHLNDLLNFFVSWKVYVYYYLILNVSFRFIDSFMVFGQNIYGLKKVFVRNSHLSILLNQSSSKVIAIVHSPSSADLDGDIGLLSQWPFSVAIYRFFLIFNRNWTIWNTDLKKLNPKLKELFC
jgi:hypothetical protein